MLQLLHRVAWSIDVFSSFATATTLADARSKLALSVGPIPHHGDLVRVVGDGVDDLHVFDAARSSFVEVARPRGATPWFERWEGSDANAEDMLRACTAVDRRRLVLAACDCAETALRYVPDGEDRPRIAIETARSWARGKATTEDVRRARENAWRHATENAWRIAIGDGGITAEFSAWAAYTTVAKPAVDGAARAINAVASATATSGIDIADAFRSMAPLVRRHVPLPVLACSIVGAAYPLSLHVEA